MKVRRIAAVALCAILLCPLAAEADGDAIPVPYGPAEFPDWQMELRRAEIISFGALPFVTFFSSLYYNVYRYYDHDRQKSYLPWPLSSGKDAVPLAEDEQKKIFMYSAGISVGVAAFDFIWRTVRHEMEARREERENAEPIVITPVEE